MPCERKHVEAILVAVDGLQVVETWDNNNRPSFTLDGLAELDASVRSALSACDESPCVWAYNKEGWSGNCPNAMTWYENPIGQAFTFCPHCGRKIAPMPSAPEVGK